VLLIEVNRLRVIIQCWAIKPKTNDAALIARVVDQGDPVVEVEAVGVQVLGLQHVTK
jgi:hypothetical protein